MTKPKPSHTPTITRRHTMSQPDPLDERSAVDTEDGGEQLQPVPNWVSDTWISCSPLAPPSPSDLVDTAAISQLVDSEPDFMPLSDYLRRFRNRSVHVTSRQDSVNWILRVNAHYRFSPVTVLLVVNYFDRFLSAHSFPACGWPFQLLSGKKIGGAQWISKYSNYIRTRDRVENGAPGPDRSQLEAMIRYPI